MLLPERAFFWSKQKSLIVSDVHLGKAGHFRKHGIPVSTKVHIHDLTILDNLIKEHKPKEVLLLGDLFHSHENSEWNDFIRFLKNHDSLDFILIEGNHDILSEYPDELKVVKKLVKGPFSFTHIKEEDQYYNISGHIHPGVRINGKARQGITLPCFWFSSEFAVVPAFGQFTGVKKVKPKPEDKLYAIAGNKVVELI